MLGKGPLYISFATLAAQDTTALISCQKNNSGWMVLTTVSYGSVLRRAGSRPGASADILHFINIVFNFSAQPFSTIAELRVLST
ncbi:hypothetical protein [Rhizobium sp. Leaf311]|uniref:hypothetical protein n=1 Tax=Rhizobium sp. Leaf311 TaxID=1736332 RepID=UPI0012E3E57C|nr:hypothetical protein [Rhizobium sp. Leaf311]